MSTRVQQRMNFTEIVRLCRERQAVVVGLDGGQFDATITIETVDVHKHRFYCHVKGAQLLLCRNDLIPKYAIIDDKSYYNRRLRGIKR